MERKTGAEFVGIILKYSRKIHKRAIGGRSSEFGELV